MCSPDGQEDVGPHSSLQTDTATRWAAQFCRLTTSKKVLPMTRYAPDPTDVI